MDVYQHINLALIEGMLPFRNETLMTNRLPCPVAAAASRRRRRSASAVRRLHSAAHCRLQSDHDDSPTQQFLKQYFEANNSQKLPDTVDRR